MYKSLDKKAITVMRINALISGIILIIVLSIICLIFKNKLLYILFPILIIFIILNITIFSSIRYKRYKYLVTEEKIEIKKGLFFITRSIILIKRVQKIEVTTGPIDRKFDLSNINIYTASGMDNIKFLNNEEAEKLSTKLNELLKKNLEKNNEN